MTANEIIQATSYPLKSTPAATAFGAGVRDALDGKPANCYWGGKVVKQAYAAGHKAGLESKEAV